MFNFSISFVEMPGKDVFDAIRTSVVEMKMQCVFLYVNMEMYIKNNRQATYNVYRYLAGNKRIFEESATLWTDGIIPYSIDEASFSGCMHFYFST